MPRVARVSNRLRVRIVITLLARSVTNSTRLVSRRTPVGVSVSRVAGVRHGMEDGLRSVMILVEEKNNEAST
jgi:hypothetical protein